MVEFIYRLKYPHNQRTVMPVACLDRAFDLAGNGYEKQVPATADIPAHTRKIPGATQEDLKWLLETDECGDWSGVIEKVPADKVEAKALPKDAKK